MDKVWLSGTYPAAISDYASCRDCDWHVSYYSQNGKWNSKTLSKAKLHVRETKHKVEYNQRRASLIKYPEETK